MLHELINGTLKIFKAVFFMLLYHHYFADHSWRQGGGGRARGPRRFLGRQVQRLLGRLARSVKRLPLSVGQIRRPDYAATPFGTVGRNRRPIEAGPVVFLTSSPIPVLTQVQWHGSMVGKLSHPHTLINVHIKLSQNDLLWKFQVKEPCLCIWHVKSSGSFHVLYLFARFQPHK